MAKEVTAGVEQHSVDQAESAQVEECVTVAQTSAACEARVAAVYDMAQVVASAPLPSYLDVVRLVGDQRLEDDVLRDFDPASHLFELSSSWVSLMMEASSFGEKLQVSSLYLLFSLSFWLDVRFFCLLLIFFFLRLRPTLEITQAFLALAKLKRNWPPRWIS